MNIYQCQRKAQEIGFDKAKFCALFPKGPVNCQWIDAYFGFITVDLEGLRDGFLTVDQIDDMFPDLFVSEPYIDGD